jgi:hypothetical protein
MAQTNAPFGFQPSFHPSGLDRASPYNIAAAYGTNLFKNQPVILNTNGTVVAGTAAADLLGVLAGVEYTDPTGKPVYSPNWIASTATMAGTPIRAWVYDDPEIVYRVQADGTVAQAAVGDQADVTNVSSGSTSVGLSTATLSATLAGAGVQAQFRIIGISPDVDNAFGDPFVVLQVKLARSQYVANKVAI